MGARENNAILTLTVTSTLALGLFLSSPTQGWGQNTSDPFAPDYVAPSEPVATPKAPTPTAAPQPAQPTSPTAPPAPVKASSVPEQTVTQAPSSPKPVTLSSETLKVPSLSPAEDARAAEDSSSFLDKLSNLFSSEETEKTSTKKQQIQTVKEAPVKNTPPVETAPAPQKIAEPAPTPTPEPTVRTATTNDPFSPASVSPAQPTATPTPPPPLTTPRAEPVEEPRMVTESTPQGKEPSFLDRIGDLFTQEEEQKTKPEQPASQAVAQTAEQPTVEPAPKTEPAPEEPGFFERIGQALTSPFSSQDEETQNSKKKQKTPPPQPKKHPQPLTNAVKESAPAEAAPHSAELDPRLKAAQLGLGKDILLGQGDNQLSKQAKCFTKNRGTIAFCTSPTRWPDPIARHFQVSTHLYKGVRGIIKYDGAIATRLYAIFDSDGFEEVVQYFEEQYGPATNQFNRHTRLLKENIDNQSYIWRKPNPNEGLVEVMEIRQFSDMRGPRTDLAHSTIRLYFEGSREIFTMASDLDFMHLR